jgi:WS/DGAT/MGAT family acyltransferase
VRRPIDPVDTIWLNMDRPNNLMVIESLMTCADPVDWDRLRDTFAERVVDRYPVFRQRPVFSRVPLAMPHWEDDDGFDIERHLHRHTLEGDDPDRALQEYVNGQIDRPLKRDRPLWELHLLDGYGEGAAIYSRLHHALADGIALLQVLLSVTDGQAAPAEPAAEAAAHDSSHGPLGAAVHAAEAAGAALFDLSHMITPHLPEDAFTLARKTASVAAKLTLSHRPATALIGSAGQGKHAVWAPPFPLADVVEVGHRTGTTVNDVLVAALAGAVSTYLQEHDGDAVDLPTMVPVNLRPADEPPPRELGNKFALVLLSLPSGLETPFARLAETKRRMDEIKHSPEAVLTFGIIRGIGRTGREMERHLVDFFADKASGVTTNVPGPREPRYLAGSRITSMLGWVPQSGNQTLGTCIFTYDGNVHVGFKTDADTVSHPDRLVEAFHEELLRLVAMAREPEETSAR